MTTEDTVSFHVPAVTPPCCTTSDVARDRVWLASVSNRRLASFVPELARERPVSAVLAPLPGPVSVQG